MQYQKYNDLKVVRENSRYGLPGRIPNTSLLAKQLLPSRDLRASDNNKCHRSKLSKSQRFVCTRMQRGSGLFVPQLLGTFKLIITIGGPDKPSESGPVKIVPQQSEPTQSKQKVGTRLGSCISQTECRVCICIIWWLPPKPSSTPGTPVWIASPLSHFTIWLCPQNHPLPREGRPDN